MNSKQAPLSKELRLIELIKEITSESLIGDDCALLAGNTLASSDMLVQGKHFLLPQMSYEDIGWKSMAVNLSDIAAMAGIPEYAIVNIAMPESMGESEFRRLYFSIHECAQNYGTRIAGGDLTGGPCLVISVTVLGRCGKAGAVSRTGAKAGDLLIVSGDFGASALGLAQILKGEKADASSSYVLARHLRPEPRLKEAENLAETCGADLHSLMDTSDGLADALLQTAKASGLCFKIDAEKIPRHEESRELACRLGLDLMELALYGGEDYELLASVTPEAWGRLSESGFFTCIGKVAASEELRVGDSPETVQAPGEAPAVFLSSGGKQERLLASKVFQHWQ